MKKIKELVFILREHQRANKAFEEMLTKKYGERAMVMALAEIYFSFPTKKNKKKHG